MRPDIWSKREHGALSSPGARFTARGVWAVFVLFPLVNAATGKGSVAGKTLTIAGAAVFVATYLLLLVNWRGGRSGPVSRVLVGALIAIASALTLLQSPSWGFLFCYCAASTAVVIGDSAGFWLVALCTVLAGTLPAIAGANGGATVSFVASTAGIGLLMLLMRDLRVRNEELSSARAELARMAVARERERFARDLHDLLGHTLSVIALKAELAGRLLPDRTDDAAGEVRDLERVARAALSEVREAVSGYRRPTLERELAGARMALAAARIEATVNDDSPLLSAESEAVLAWAVREGATNVIRHSRAHRCTITIAGDGLRASAEVADDGVGEDAAGSGAPDGTGNGLAGLGERARAVGGRVETRPRRGGFLLRVEVPYEAETAPGGGPAGELGSPSAPTGREA